MNQNIKKWPLKILIGLCFFNILTWLVVYDLSKTHSLEVTFFDVGQGDAILIETPKRQQILIDGGPTSEILEKLGKEIPFWDRTIDLIILTHPERDHLSGLIEVLKRYKVENILWTGVVRDTAEYKEWLKLINKEKAEVKIAKTNQRIISSTRPGRVEMIILYPFDNLEGKELKDSNNSSIVLKLVFGENAFLLTGDIYKSGEKEILEKGEDIDSDVLKISHHGSKTSTSEDFLTKVSPETAIISVGKDNKYGHPHSETLETLNKFGIRTLRTDEEGNIKIKSNGKIYEVSTF